MTVVFVELPNTKIEFLEALGEGSPIAKFMERNPEGGIHHICYEVEDIIAARVQLKAQGARVLGDGEPKLAHMASPVLFLHPKDFLGTLDRAGAGLTRAFGALPILRRAHDIAGGACCRPQAAAIKPPSGSLA